MHGDIAQNQREVTMKRFKENKFQVLVATDVASRGLDIPDVELVIQLEPPKDTESYIHRSGRTARAGKSGTCITFYNHKNIEFVDRVEQLAGIRLERVAIPTESDIKKAQRKGILRKLEDVDKEVLDMFDETADLLLQQHNNDAKLALKIVLAYCSGHYKQKIPTRSLLTGRDGHSTVMMKVEEGRKLDDASALSIIERYWSQAISQSITTIKMFRSGNGVVFDLRKTEAESFVENFKLLKERQADQVDFDVKICSALPDVEGGGFDGERSSRRRDDQPRGGDGPYGPRGAGGGEGRYGGSRGGGYGDRDNRRDGQGGGSKSNQYGRRDEGDRSGGGGGGKGGATGWNAGNKYSDINDIDFEDSKPRHQNRGHSFDPHLTNRNHQYEESKADYSLQFQRTEPEQRHDSRANYFDSRKQDYNPNEIPLGNNQSSNLFFSNLSFELTEQDIMAYMKDYKPLRAKLHCGDDGRSKGQGFIHLESNEMARMAVQNLNNVEFEGRRLHLNYAYNKQGTQNPAQPVRAYN